MFDKANFMEFVRDLTLGHAELLTGKTIPQQDDEPTSEDVEVLLAEMKEERL